MMPNERLTYLLQQYVSGLSTEGELHELTSYVAQDDHKEQMLDTLQEMALSQPFNGAFDAPRFLPLLEGIVSVKAVAHHPLVPVRPVPFYRRWWAAAAIILLLATGAYLWFQPADQPKAEIAVVDIPPGQSGAILTLADGTQVSLDSLTSGIVATEHGVNAVLTNGQLMYDGKISGTIAYHTMTTPNGRQFEMTLPDGSRVWLNAGSSIRYPTSFAGNNRSVEMTGEAYFEVTSNKLKPFIVDVNGAATVEVLGTHFNVNAYTNEASINTTLLEGSVKVNGTTIAPGQQAQISDDITRVVDNAEMDKVMAWKNGLFNFNGLTFEQIMRQLERWYDIEVLYEKNKAPSIPLAGKMTRGVSLNDLLAQLEEMGVHFRLENKTLFVLP